MRATGCSFSGGGDGGGGEKTTATSAGQKVKNCLALSFRRASCSAAEFRFEGAEQIGLWRAALTSSSSSSPRFERKMRRTTTYLQIIYGVVGTLSSAPGL